ncbi:cation-translocating P-type ATPase [Candidatus Saccharibacteria bacterium]|nr:cation-translocating P-type ATPase [Candidatus Saccharibacteria bacterium]MCB9821025.1 cation-translocating P-type ATPase [Candidatus Nomurabacteria bacterium]
MSNQKSILAYQLSSTETVDSFNSSVKTGLSQADVLERRATYGLNSLATKKSINPAVLFINQFKDVLVIILLVSAIISWAVSLISVSGTSQTYSQEFIDRSMACINDPISPSDGASSSCNLASKLAEKEAITIPESSKCQTKELDQQFTVAWGGGTACNLYVMLGMPKLPVSDSSQLLKTNNEGSREAILIFVIVFAIAIIGFLNEYRAEKTVEALKKLVGSKAQVRRAGQIFEIDAIELVPGDVVVLDEGSKVPADLRLISVSNLYANEASLTGESVPVSKNTLAQKGDKPLGDQKCMAFAGTFITQGRAEGIVTATGQATEIGKIAKLVNEVEEEATPMQRKLDDLGKKLGIFILLICAGVFAIIFLFVDSQTGQSLLERSIFAFTAAVALAVAAIPEGLAFVVRISLALGARRMATKQALVRKLSAVEALGSTDIICSDKTGTLTRGEMTVRAIHIDGKTYSLTGSGYETTGKLTIGKKQVKPNEAIFALMRIGVLCNNAQLQHNQILGDPTEAALLVSAAKLGMQDADIRSVWGRETEIPFTSLRKMMSVVTKNPSGGYSIATKGATEKVLALCSHYLTSSGQQKPLNPNIRQQILDENHRLSSQALRVLAFASDNHANQPTSNTQIESNLTFVGLQAMMDPPRSEVIDVIHRVQTESGIRVIMITGDYIDTATAIAEEIGLHGKAISGAELDSLSQAEFEAIVEDVSVYARVDPEHKIRIVQALKKHGHQVAMTGDGVNDAPAIKAADIGIAMGIAGTDASKEAADLILLDDQFLTIISAIEEGRGIFDNVRKFVNFLISCNIAEVLAVTFGILFFDNLILTAAQLLFINIVTDGLPAVALGSDPAQKDSLRQKPTYYQQPILNRRTWVEIFVFGGLMTTALLFQFWYNLHHESILAAVSAGFTAMVVYELVRLIDIRTDYNIRWFSNPWLSVAIASSFVLQFAVLYIPKMASYFEVGPLSRHDWLFMVTGSAVLFAIMKSLNPVFDRIGSETHAVVK